MSEIQFVQGNFVNTYFTEILNLFCNAFMIMWTGCSLMSQMNYEIQSNPMFLICIHMYVCSSCMQICRICIYLCEEYLA